MDTSRRTEINRIADNVRAGLELATIPFPVDDAVQRLGGRIAPRRDADVEALVRKDGDAFVIELGDQPETRRRFSVAHELGHLFLHMGYLINPARWAEIDEYRDSPKHRFGFSEEEYEAHEFAAALLMPAAEFRTAVAGLAQGGQIPLPSLAQHFNVSPDAAHVRGRWLGLFEWPR